jgi:glycosyltransferase involved in cell wall biosynthesis
MRIRVPMKVVHVITGLNGGGAQYYLLRLLENLSSRIRSEVISLTNYGAVGPQLAAASVPVTALGMTPRLTGLARVGSLVLALRRSKPDLVHTWMYHSDLLGGLCARLAGLDTILWSVHHGNPSLSYDKARTVAIARACAFAARVVPRHIVCASSATRDRHVVLGYPSDKMTVIPGGYDLSRFRPDPAASASVRAELALPIDAPVVGMVARYHRLKGHRDFLDMAATLIRNRPEARFVLAGREVDTGNRQLANDIASLQLDGAVRLIGPRQDIHRVLCAFDVLVSPSLVEAGPLVVGEAMACGVPCVGTDVGLTRSLIGNTGCITRPGLPAELAMAVGRLLGLPGPEREALGRKARSRIVERFSIQSTARQYESLYDSLLSGRAVVSDPGQTVS